MESKYNAKRATLQKQSKQPVRAGCGYTSYKQYTLRQDEHDRPYKITPHT